MRIDNWSLLWSLWPWNPNNRWLSLDTAADPSWCLEEDNYNPGWARPGVVQADGNRSKVSCSWCEARWWWCRQLELIFHWLEIFHHVRVSQLSQSYLFNYQHQETLPPPPLQMAHDWLDYTALLLQQLVTGVIIFYIIQSYTNQHFKRPYRVLQNIW